MAWLRLIRWSNLFIILLTQLLVWWCVILPAHPDILNPLNFCCLMLSTVLVAAAGYIINDYFDIKIDAINRPEKVVLENQIPRRQAIIAHTVLNVIALLLAAYVARQAHHYEWLLVQLACTLLLWFYSTTFKRQFMTGNVVVALLTALTIIVLVIYEPSLHPYILLDSFIQIDDSIKPNPVRVAAVYTFFAFVLTWMREIVKDMEDFKGDAEQGCVTMPIKWGLLKSTRFVQLLGVITMVILVNAGVKLCAAHWWPLGIYSLAVLVVPLFLWCINLQRKATTEHYHTTSRQIKIIMVLGIGSLIIYYLQVHA